MNRAQTINMVVAVIVGGTAAAAARVGINVTDWTTDITDLVLLAIAASTWFAGHTLHATPASSPSTMGSKSEAMKLMVVFMSLALAILTGAVGCATSPQAASYQAVGTATVTVEQALKAYDAWAKAGKTSIAQNQEVAAAYAKYQAAIAVVCDAGADYAATSVTNSAGLSGAQVALSAAEANATQSLTDLENLITSFGAKL